MNPTYDDLIGLDKLRDGDEFAFRTVKENGELVWRPVPAKYWGIRLEEMRKVADVLARRPFSPEVVT